MGSKGKITMPKDADGCEIPLDTKVLYDAAGKAYEVEAFEFLVIDGILRVSFLDHFIAFYSYDMRLAPPDSWEKLLEDLDNAAKGGDNAECLYMRRDGMEVQCPGCRLEDVESDDIACSYLAYADIAARIRKLRGEGE